MITVVALVFSLLLFEILVCWVAYVSAERSKVVKESRHDLNCFARCALAAIENKTRTMALVGTRTMALVGIDHIPRNLLIVNAVPEDSFVFN
jgi:hypothetical protein